LFDTLDLTGSLTGGTIHFSFLSDFDIASEVATYESMTLLFLTGSSLGDYADTLSYRFSGGLRGFQYDVFEDGGSLYLRASNTIPAPGALLLTSIGLGLLRLRRRRAEG
jgi:hypothetical protein